MKTGFAEKDITPPVGTERAGAYRKLYIKEKRDTIKARASVFDDGRNFVVFVGVDCCLIGRNTVKAVRKMISESCGIKPENIMIAASHTHSGGSLWGFRPDELVNAPELIKKLALEISPSVDIAYEKIVINGIHEAVKEAFDNRKEHLFSIGRGFEGAAVFNRRFRMKNGESWTHPGKGNPDIIEPAGPIDPEVGVLGAWTNDGKLSGCIVNYTCHGTAFSGMNASADWISAMEKTIRGAFSQDAVVVFLNGACGDITQVDNIGLRKNNTPDEWVDIVGKRVGAEAVKVLVSSEKGAFQTVSAITEKLRVKRRISNRKKTEEAFRIANDFLGNVSEEQPMSDDFIWAKERILADYLNSVEPEREFEVQAIQVGPAVFMANPSEYFCSLGLDIKKSCPNVPFPFVVELANDIIGYIPDEEAFSSKGGGYETRLTSYSNLEISTGRKIADASIRLSGKMKPDKVPSAPLIEKAGSPWGYGNKPPETE
ncbi:MAG: hypothetical protein A2017_02035 [Lentisphaerae bacterium GWF2_44_16]|nr:MAG: hypothetical protein A2017_02035 [Lentisphaerae bacterium GWF2_44_16]